MNFSGICCGQQKKQQQIRRVLIHTIDDSQYMISLMRIIVLKLVESHMAHFQKEQSYDGHLADKPNRGKNNTNEVIKIWMNVECI